MLDTRHSWLGLLSSKQKQHSVCGEHAMNSNHAMQYRIYDYTICVWQYSLFRKKYIQIISRAVYASVFPFQLSSIPTSNKQTNKQKHKPTNPKPNQTKPTNQPTNQQTNKQTNNKKNVPTSSARVAVRYRHAPGRSLWKKTRFAPSWNRSQVTRLLLSLPANAAGWCAMKNKGVNGWN